MVYTVRLQMPSGRESIHKINAANLGELADTINDLYPGAVYLVMLIDGRRVKDGGQ